MGLQVHGLWKTLVQIKALCTRDKDGATYPVKGEQRGLKMPKKQYCGSYNEGICKDERYLDKPCPFINDHNWSICEYWKNKIDSSLRPKGSWDASRNRGKSGQWRKKRSDSGKKRKK